MASLAQRRADEARRMAEEALRRAEARRREEAEARRAQGGNSIGFLDRLTDRLKMGDGLKMSDFGLGMS